MNIDTLLICFMICCTIIICFHKFCHFMDLSDENYELKEKIKELEKK